jgi:hypothetical protein
MLPDRVRKQVRVRCGGSGLNRKSLVIRSFNGVGFGGCLWLWL